MLARERWETAADLWAGSSKHIRYLKISHRFSLSSIHRCTGRRQLYQPRPPNLANVGVESSRISTFCCLDDHLQRCESGCSFSWYSALADRWMVLHVGTLLAMLAGRGCYSKTEHCSCFHLSPNPDSHWQPDLAPSVPTAADLPGRTPLALRLHRCTALGQQRRLPRNTAATLESTVLWTTNGCMHAQLTEEVLLVLPQRAATVWMVLLKMRGWHQAGCVPQPHLQAEYLLDPGLAATAACCSWSLAAAVATAKTALFQTLG